MISFCEKETFFGAALTVILHFLVLFFIFAVIVAFPIFFPFIFPDLVTETTLLLEERKVILEEVPFVVN